jgi:signal transduction histidine kinase
MYSLLEEIGQGAGRITELVRALKEYTYLDRAPIQAVDIHAGLDSTLVILRSKLRDVTVRREYASDLPRVQARGSELNQVWTNLIDNAIDATNGKGTVTLRTRRDDEWVIVEIEDNGSGIPEEALPNLFDPFFTTKAPGKGTGLGLNISHNIIVQKHQGRIDVSSQPGRTRFVVRIPLDCSPSES